MKAELFILAAFFALISAELHFYPRLETGTTNLSFGRIKKRSAQYPQNYYGSSAINVANLHVHQYYGPGSQITNFQIANSQNTNGKSSSVKMATPDF